MATTARWRQEREEKFERMRQTLTEAVESLVSGEDWKQALAFAARFRARSFANTLLIEAQHLLAYEQGRVLQPSPTYVAGRSQWNRLGRMITKGQTSYRIFAPVKARFASRDPDAPPESWRKLRRGENPRPGEVVRVRVVAIRPAAVWDVSQTHGEPIPQLPQPRPPAGEAPPGLADALSEQIRRAGFRVQEVAPADLPDGVHGLTNYERRVVRVRADVDAAFRATILAHELAHVMMHDPADDERSHHQGVREVEAQSVAYMICVAHGMQDVQFSAPYVATWANRVPDTEPAEVVRRTGERVRQVARTVLDALPHPPADGTPPGLSRGAAEPAEPTAVSTPRIAAEPRRAPSR